LTGCAWGSVRFSATSSYPSNGREVFSSSEGSDWDNGLAPSFGRLLRFTPQQSIHGWNEKKRCEGCEQQPADDRARERSVLLAAFANPERHRDHTEDHRAGRHENRTQPCVACLDRSFACADAGLDPLVAKSHHKDAVGGRQTDAHERSHK